MKKAYVTVGKSVTRLDARDKVRGVATYIVDMKFSGMLHGKVLYSKFPHARIVKIDTSRAKRLPGVKAVITGEDMPFLHGEALYDTPFLAVGKVRYMGEAVAAVAAVDEETAEEALDLIEVEYEELPAVFNPGDALKQGAPILHEKLGEYYHPPVITPVPGTNICNHTKIRKGDIEKGFKEADHIFEDTFTTQMTQHGTIEPHAAICMVTPDGKLTLWGNNDSPYRARREIAVALKIPLHRVRLVGAPYIGGNFGGKGGLKAEAIAIALAWNYRGRPIKIVNTREEEFTSTVVRHPTVITLKTGVKKDGTIVARQTTCLWDTGAYAEKGPTVSRMGGASSAGVYNIPHVSIDSYCVYTNNQISGALRGYSGPQTAWAYESQMDMIAERLGLDPVQMRLKCAYDNGSVHAGGQVLSDVTLKTCLNKVVEAMKWDKPSPLTPYRGRGVAFGERFIKTPFASSAFLKINEDGTVDLISSTSEVGQGGETTMCQIAAEELGVPLASVSKASPDTAYTPFDESTTSSRSTFHMGNAIRMAARDAKEQILQMAATQMKVPVKKLTIVDGNVQVVGKPETATPLGQVMRRRYGASGGVLGRGFYFPDGLAPEGEYFTFNCIFWMYCAQGAEVEVDPRTGKVTVLKMVAAHDVGTAINPKSCIEQIAGGVSFGIGFTFYEDLIRENGKTMNPSFLSYKMPTTMDMPPLDPYLVEPHCEQGPFGAKAVGEPSSVPTAPAIANAIANAIGVRITDLPITPDKILAALKNKT
ncbi:MAG: molybdopterin-dependent oxidoreductase [Deltaproteobacteria bacterium]|nr:molybdopterin-dependent oxidoreductase [Deltaproteobacteria bacterium]